MAAPAAAADLFRFSLAQIRELGGFLCGRRLYETMLQWEPDPSMRENELDLVETRTFGSRVLFECDGRPRDGSH